MPKTSHISAIIVPTSSTRTRFSAHTAFPFSERKGCPYRKLKPFDAGSPRLSRDQLSRLDMDRMKCPPSVLDVKADCVHRAVGAHKRIGD